MSLGERGLGIWDNLEAFGRSVQAKRAWWLSYSSRVYVIGVDEDLRKLEAVMCFHTYYMYMLIENHMLLLQ